LPTSGSGELGTYVYLLTATSTSGPGLILTTLHYNSCASACSTTPPTTYNCISGGCVDPGDGTGTYPSLGACEAECIPVTYNCVSGECVNPGDGTGLYPTLGDCLESCIPITYNCVSGTCEDPLDGSGVYPSLALCEENCAPSLDWECVNLGAGLECVYVGGGAGTYVSLAQCTLDCGA